MYLYYRFFTIYFSNICFLFLSKQLDYNNTFKLSCQDFFLTFFIFFCSFLSLKFQPDFFAFSGSFFTLTVFYLSAFLASAESFIILSYSYPSCQYIFSLYFSQILYPLFTSALVILFVYSFLFIMSR